MKKKKSKKKKKITVKREWLIIALAIFVALFSVWLAWNNSRSEKKERSGLIKIYYASGHPKKAPIMWQEGEDVRISGIGSDLAERLFSSLGVNLFPKVVGAWEEALEKAKSGEIDVLVGAQKTSELEEYFEFSDPYAEDPVSLFIKKGKYLRFNRKEDLVGKKGIAISDESFGKEFDDFSAIKLNIKRVETLDEALENLQNGKVDYFIYPFYSGEKMLKEKNLSEKIVILPKNVSSDIFSIVISKKSPLVEYLPRINALIEKYKSDGTLDKIIEENKAKMMGVSL